MTLLLLHSAADISSRAIALGGQGSDPEVLPLGNWPVYVDMEPDTPDELLTCKDTTGTDHGRTMPDGAIVQHYGIQVVIRSMDKLDGYQKTQALRHWFAEEVYQASVTIDTATYIIHCFAKIGQTLSVGLDSPHTMRWLHTLNVQAAIRRVS